MTRTLDDDRLDEICSGGITRAEVLNALHACRTDHPLGKNNSYKWRNAYALAAQCSSFEVKAQDLDWLREHAQSE